MMRGIILYGPPAAGKSTITDQLHEADPVYVLFRRLKVGSGRSADYRMITEAHRSQLHADREVIWENEQYGNVYSIDRTALLHVLSRGSVPVVHVGQPAAIVAITHALPAAHWLVVDLRCSREEAVMRLSRRSATDVLPRLRVWDATDHLASADLYINTDAVAATDAALRVHQRAAQLAPPGSHALTARDSAEHL